MTARELAKLFRITERSIYRNVSAYTAAKGKLWAMIREHVSAEVASDPTAKEAVDKFSRAEIPAQVWELIYANINRD